MADGGNARTGTFAIFGIAVLVNLILSIFLLDQVRRTREQVADLSSELASKQDGFSTSAACVVTPTGASPS